MLALKPMDLAEAHYQFALSQHRAGDGAAARRQIAKALELAPNFNTAQDLLLEIRAGTRNG